MPSYGENLAGAGYVLADHDSGLGMDFMNGERGHLGGFDAALEVNLVVHDGVQIAAQGREGERGEKQYRNEFEGVSDQSRERVQR